MIIRKTDLEIIFEIQQLLLESKKLEQAAKALATGTELELAREQLLANSSELSEARSKHDEILREIKRLEADLELVSKREAIDRDRLSKTAVSRDALGIQHELETLAKRRSDLEEIELGLLESRDESNRLMHELSVENERLEMALKEAKALAQTKMLDLKADHLKLQEAIAKLRATVSADLIELFDKKFARGIAVGRLSKNACTACNMSLTATALADLHQKPETDLVTCPECQAILIR